MCNEPNYSRWLSNTSHNCQKQTRKIHKYEHDHFSTNQSLHTSQHSLYEYLSAQLRLKTLPSQQAVSKTVLLEYKTGSCLSYLVNVTLFAIGWCRDYNSAIGDEWWGDVHYEFWEVTRFSFSCGFELCPFRCIGTIKSSMKTLRIFFRCLTLYINRFTSDNWKWEVSRPFKAYS